MGEGKGQTRTFHSKSRRGCITCKARHVRCDETKPKCLACAKVGKECEGYLDEKDLKFRWRRRDATQMIFRNKFGPASTSPSSTSAPKLPLTFKNTTPSPASPLQIVKHEARPDPELQAWEYFHIKTVPLLTSFFPSEFWSRLVPCISETAPAIRHCILAIGAWHLNEDGHHNAPKALPSAGPTEPVNFSLAQYGRALTALREGMTNPAVDSQSKTVALLASLLFTIYESLRGRRSEVSVHLKHGLLIAKEATPTTRNNSDRLAIELFLGRLGLSQAMFESRAMWSDDLKDPYNAGVYSLLDVAPEPRHLSELQMYSAAIHNLGNDIYRFFWKTKNSVHASYQDRKAEQEQLMQRCDEWTLKVHASGVLSEQTPGSKIMQARYVLARTLLDCSLTLYQTTFDYHVDAFECIIDLVRAAFLKDPAKPELGYRAPGFFSVDIGAISILTYVSFICRHPKIRRQAVDLLKYCPRREGVWEVQTSVAVAKAVIDFEEGHAKGFSQDGMPIISEEHRVHHIESSGISPLAAGAAGDHLTTININLMVRSCAGDLTFQKVPVQVVLGSVDPFTPPQCG